MKHALLIALLTAFHRKPAPFMVLDTHAGIGSYDLTADPAQRTGEWHAGIGRLLDAPPARTLPLRTYLDLVRPEMPHAYPGSPAIAARMLRPGDALVCCELHPDDAPLLRRHFARNPAVHVHERDGYEAIAALLPPRAIRRGLVLLDPPFERADEFQRLADAMLTARARFPTGIIAGWYPIKHRAPVRAFHDDLRERGLPDVLAAELTLRPPLDPSRLNGAGLVVASPPFGFEQQARDILGCLADLLGEDQAGYDVRRIAEERS